jgi:hypothetical protein
VRTDDVFTGGLAASPRASGDTRVHGRVPVPAHACVPGWIHSSSVTFPHGVPTSRLALKYECCSGADGTGRTVSSSCVEVTRGREGGRGTRSTFDAKCCLPRSGLAHGRTRRAFLELVLLLAVYVRAR